MNQTLPAAQPVHSHDPDLHAVHAAETQLKDPVCGMTVTPESKHTLRYAGQPFYFCSAGCKAKFAADPDKYISPSNPGGASATQASPAPEQSTPDGTVFTCPMHPEVRQDHPGACPKAAWHSNPSYRRSTKERPRS